jgi:PPM family protein phosphatase
MFGRAKPVKVHVFGKTDVGKSRDHNEDCFIVADLTRKKASLQPDVREHEVGERGSLFMVADGMGGAAAGELASQMATETVYESLVQRWLADREATPQRFARHLKEAVEAANTRIHSYAKEHQEVRGMGTTTTAVGILAEHLFLTQIGDSRAYLIRGTSAHQLTKDQSLMQRLVEAGELTEEEAARSDRRNIILQALGPDAKVKVDLTHQPIRRGDILLLCSDGLSGQVKKEEMADVISKTPDLSDACNQLITVANERGGPDNITVVLVKFDGDGLKGAGADAEEVGHQVYPLIDTESSTEPVPVYKGSKPPEPKKEGKGRLFLLLGIAAVAVALAWLVLMTQ